MSLAQTLFTPVTPYTEIGYDPNFASVTFLARYETTTLAAEVGTAVSSSLQAAVTLKGGAGKFGDGLSISGSNASVKYAAGTNYIFPGDFTVEGWIKIGSQAAGYLFDIGSNGFALQWSSTNLVIVISSSQAASAAHNLNLTQWNHIAVSRTGSSLRMFANGVLISTITNSATLGSSSSTLTIANYGSGNNSVVGTIDSIRFTKGVGRYTATFTPPTTEFPLTSVSTAPATVFLASFDSSTTPEVGPTLNSSSGAAQATGTGKFAGGLTLTGTSSYARYNASTDFLFTAGLDFTIEGYGKWSVIAGNQYIFDIGTNGIQIQTNGTTAVYVLVGGAVYINAPCTFTANTFFHFAVVRSGVTLSLYINGKLIGENVQNINLTDMGSNSGLLTLGNYGGGGGFGASGTFVIDNFRITRGLAIYKGVFNPPIIPFTETITYVGSSSTTTFPTGTIDGDLVVVTVAATAGVPVVSGSGAGAYTLAAGPTTWAAPGYSQVTYYHVVANGETAAAVTNLGSGTVFINTYRGASRVVAGTMATSANGAGVATTTASAITTTTANATVVGVVIDRDNVVYGGAAPSGFTTRAGLAASFFADMLYDTAVPTLGTVVGPIDFGQTSTQFAATAILLELVKR